MLKTIRFPPSIRAIGDSCFEGCTSLEGVWLDPQTKLFNSVSTKSFSSCNFSRIHIPPCIKTLGQSCFANNPYLTEITFDPDSAQTIMSEAFMDCPLVAIIELPNSLSSLSLGGLSQMYGLKEIKVMAQNPKFKSVEGILFDSTETELVSFPSGLEKYEIGGNIETINEKAFFKCIKLEELNFSRDVRLSEIGPYTFSECNGLKSISIPSSVKTIKPYAFSKCGNLSSVSFGNESTLENLESNIFYECVHLREVRFNNKALKTVSNSVFQDCTDLISFMSTSVETLRESAFSGCKSLKNIYLLGVKFIGSKCFFGCTSLERIILRNDLLDLGIDSFRGCTGLTSVEYCGHNEFGKEAFTGVDLPISVLHNYPYDKMGGLNVWKVLDGECNMPTPRFTVGSAIQDPSGVFIAVALSSSKF